MQTKVESHRSLKTLRDLTTKSGHEPEGPVDTQHLAVSDAYPVVSMSVEHLWRVRPRPAVEGVRGIGEGRHAREMRGRRFGRHVQE